MWTSLGPELMQSCYFSAPSPSSSERWHCISSPIKSNAVISPLPFITFTRNFLDTLVVSYFKKSIYCQCVPETERSTTETKHIPSLKSRFYEIMVLLPIEDAGFPVQMSKYTFSFCFMQISTCLKLQAHAEC